MPKHTETTIDPLFAAILRGEDSLDRLPDETLGEDDIIDRLSFDRFAPDDDDGEPIDLY